MSMWACAYDNSVAAGLRSSWCYVHHDELRSALYVTAATQARTVADISAMGSPVRCPGTHASCNQARPASGNTGQAGMGTSRPGEDQPSVQTGSEE